MIYTQLNHDRTSLGPSLKRSDEFLTETGSEFYLGFACENNLIICHHQWLILLTMYGQKTRGHY